MKLRGLLISAALLAVLSGMVWWSNKREKEKEGKPAADAPPKVLEIPEDQVQQIEVKKKDTGSTIVKRDASGKWQIVAPKQLPADQDSVKTLAGTFSSLSADKLIEEKAADLNTYGLNAPSMEVIVTKKDGKPQKLLLGDETPTGSSFFARLDGDPRVFTLASWNKTSIDKSANDLRDKRLLTFDSEKLTRIELTAKGKTLEFGKNNKNQWAILKPGPYRADNFQAEELVRRLKDAKMDTGVSDDDAKKFTTAYNSGTPVATARVTDAAGMQQLDVRRDKDKNYYVKSSVVEGIHKVASDLGEGLDKTVEDFRNKKLFDFGFTEVGKVEVKEGSRIFTFSKSADKWNSGGKTMDSTGVQSLIDKLRDLSSIKFVEKGGGTPHLELTAVTQDGKSTEKVLVSKQGNSYFAMREGEPAVYEVDGKIVEEIQKAAADVKESKPEEKKSGDKKK
jgi:hypothetical protein